MRILSILLQFVLFLVIFLAGSLRNPFHMRWGLTSTTSTGTRYFAPDGLLLAIALWAVILVIAALKKKLPSAALTSTIALVLAIVVGLRAGFGFVTRQL